METFSFLGPFQYSKNGQNNEYYSFFNQKNGN